ncbi:MAG: type II secretion system secretin GspD [Myxococcota bacterium]|nr:type II secretion system secretin GspD [Deltaproteobacteria bacterium]MDQ3340341.1 type II secretion system secretin GspD [Myxococcota bacterium]
MASAETKIGVETPVTGEDEALYRCKSRTAEVAVSFKPDMELKELMTWVVGFTCKNFILDPRVVATGKKVTVIAPNKMSATEAYRMFLVALSTMNLTVVPKGNVLRIADAGASRRDTVPMLRKGTPTDDQVVRYILRPTYAAPDVLVQALATLKSEVGEVQQIGSMLMLTDYGGNVRDMLSLVKMVDLPKGSEGIYTITIEHANAQVVADKVGGILGVTKEVAAAPKPGSPPTALTSALTPSKVMVDERTNTIILAASDVAFERFRALAKRIDVALDIEGGQSVHVYRLSNAIAEELAKTINDTVGQTGQTAATPGAPKPPPTEGGVGTAIDGKVRVIADKPTNSLIVLSTGRDFLALKEVIISLDLARPQVYIETMIVEVTVSNDLTTDGSVHGASALDKAAILGGIHTTNLNSAAPAPTENNPTGGVMSRGLVAGLLGPSMSVLGLTIPSYGVLFNALSHTSRTNVLSTPSMMALDNETAKFKVGKSIPLERTTQTNFGTQTNVEFRELNLELELKPHITSDNQILLEVKHAAEDEGDISSFGVTLSNRNYETRVLVRDQQTIVIGGILQEKTKLTKDSVPLLGDIPLLGRLFSYNSKEKRKSNTLILLTPYIVRNQFDLERIRLRKMQEHEEFVGSLKAFDGMKYTPKMDYGRKRGLVEEINRSVEGVEEDQRTIERMGKPVVIPSGPIELPAEE